MERFYLDYHEKAQEAGILVISAAAFDSVRNGCIVGYIGNIQELSHCPYFLNPRFQLIWGFYLPRSSYERREAGWLYNATIFNLKRITAIYLSPKFVL